MEYKHSIIVHPSNYETEGLCDGIPLRMNTHSDLEDIGTIRAQQDWSSLVSKVENYRGGMGPKYSFMSVSGAQCLPPTVEVISFAKEFAFLHDGMFCFWSLHFNLRHMLVLTELFQTSPTMSIKKR